jgi:asparagine synthase (glutamine-hydrolysing)
MCGLFGSIGFAPDPAHIDIVAHRGPDGRGWEVHDSPAGPVALGHRRLAIIDTSDAGLQPMADPTGRYRLVFNGEIYNYIELRAELRARGEVFRTETDSEVLLRAYTVWGEDCLPRLRGMFAFLVWDAEKKRLFGARDRYGIKPLYLAGDGRGVALASEIKQLLWLPGLSRRMNIARVHDFLASGIADHTAETLFEGVRQLRAGECITVETASGRAVEAVRRWHPVAADDIALPEAEAAARFRALLEDSVRLHLRSDVPVGSCLSGGLDSSSIVCLMAGLMPAGERINTVSACYPGKSVDERPFIDAVVDRAGTVPHYVHPRAEDLFRAASDITWHQDEPFGSTSIFAQWCVFQEARRAGIKVMLDGQGADEQLAGYHFALPYHLAGLMRCGAVGEAGRLMLARRRAHGASLAGQALRLGAAMAPTVSARLARSPLGRVLADYGWLDSPVLREHGNRSGAMRHGAALLGLDRPKDVRGLCLTMTFASNLQMLLHWEDRSSMAHSIEARVPFLDHPLVELSLALGNAHKIAGPETKRVLRLAMSDVLPRAVAERRDKIGFETPEAAWFRGPLRTLVIGGTEATLARYPGLLNARGVRRLRDAMLAGRKPLKPVLWRIVNLGIWGERFGITL